MTQCHFLKYKWQESLHNQPSQRKVYHICSIVNMIKWVLYSIQVTHLERPFGCQSNSFNGKPGLLALWHLDRPERETGLHDVHHLLYRGKGPLLYLKAEKKNTFINKTEATILQNTTITLQPYLWFIGLERVCVRQYSQNPLVRSPQPPLELHRHSAQVLHPQGSLGAGAHGCGLKEQTAIPLHTHGKLLCYSDHIQ